MAFNSYGFILIFMPVFLFLYFMLSRCGNSGSKGIIILAGILFYYISGPESTKVLCISIIVNLCMVFLFQKAAGTKSKKLLLVTAILLNVLLLIYYKYYNFIADNIKFTSNIRIKTHDLVLPIGISFITFQQIMYVVSIWKGEIKNGNPLDYLAYILFFPKIIMGPLMEPVDFLDQLNDNEKKKIDFRNRGHCSRTLFPRQYPLSYKNIYYVLKKILIIMNYLRQI